MPDGTLIRPHVLMAVWMVFQSSWLSSPKALALKGCPVERLIPVIARPATISLSFDDPRCLTLRPRKLSSELSVARYFEAGGNSKESPRTIAAGNDEFTPADPGGGTPEFLGPICGD